MAGFINRTYYIGRLLSQTSVNVGTILRQPQLALARPFARSLVVLSNSSKAKTSTTSGHTFKCSCGCGIHRMHTKGDRELVELLQEEIQEEKKNIIAGPTSTIDDFKITRENAELILTKKFNDEEIEISLNVNHTVSDSEHEQPEADKDATLESKPDFEVDIKVGTKTLSFTCQFTDYPEEDPEHQTDTFGISEITIFDGEHDESTYCASGEILDGNLYDLFMNLLEERGITNEFVGKLVTLSTTHEHGLYIKMLQQIQDFIKRK